MHNTYIAPQAATAAAAALYVTDSGRATYSPAHMKLWPLRPKTAM